MSSRKISQRALPDGHASLPEDLDPVLRRVLLARGVHQAAELSLELGDMLQPGPMLGIDEAAGILTRAVQEGQRILVVGDFDADGATGTALAVLALRAMGAARVDFRVPNRFEFGYGLTPGLVETLSEAPPDVLMTVDSGICCNAGVAMARAQGSRVIVTDHHLPGEELPAADAIVNPNQPEDRFASKMLAGVGVVFYLLGRVRSSLREAGWFAGGRAEPMLAQYLDLVALGTVADLVPLDRNNRVLVRQGLERIRRGLARPGLLALLRCGKRDYRFASAADLGFAVGPRLNAAGRLEDMATGIRCLLSDEPDEASRLAQELDALNRQRRDMQQNMQTEALQQAEQLLATLDRGNGGALCLFDESWHQGIVGLVASRVKDTVHRPVIAFAPESNGSDVLKGSARSVKGLHIRDVLACVEARHPNLMHAYGGHAMAAGLTLSRSDLKDFEAALPVAIDTVLDGVELSHETLTDGGLGAGELNLHTARILEQAGPWGQRFPEPLFDNVFDVIDQRIVGTAHLKMIVRHVDGGETVDAIAFNRLPEDLQGARRVRLLYRLDINRWRGQECCQLRVEEIVA